VIKSLAALIFIILLLNISININNTMTTVLGQEVQGLPELLDSNLRIELVSDELSDPTSMAFLGPADILVLEKNEGTVKRIVNGEMLEEPLLDLNVNSVDERGLLGIAVSTRDNILRQTFVFLYYTEAEAKDNGEVLGNRLYRYELVNETLTNPKLLLDLPYLPGPAHNGGVITIGPDNNVYLVVGELISTVYDKTDQIRTEAQNYLDGEQADGRGGILRVTQNGEIVQPSILGDRHPLNMYYAYGIRNSFGIDFDPVTGNLWDTENGPSFGDEINLVEPGFNSGWAKVQGIWTVKERIREEGNRIHSKDNVAPLFGPHDYFVDFNGHGKYSVPKMTFDPEIVPTSIVFLDSDKLGKEYENSIFVASVNEELLHFNLTEDREDLSLNGQPTDNKVVYAPEDLKDAVLATGFDGVITDLEVGPSDGYLYVVSGIRGEHGGHIHRIVRIATP
jgi:aldose sugar dehydrogenase